MIRSTAAMHLSCALAALLISSLAVGCGQLAIRGGSTASACLPEFPYQDGWLGGDAAWSVTLPRGHDEAWSTLWLFGDSFVGAPELLDRVDAAFVHNSIALSRCGRDGFEIRYGWGEDASGAPRAFFDSGEASPYWWPFDGFAHAGSLYVGLLEVSEAPPEEVLQLPFRLTGMKLARIANPLDAPDEWRIDLSVLSRGERAFPGASMIVAGEYAYLFAFTALEVGRQPRFLVRLPLRALEAFPDDLEPWLETLVAEGSWQPGFLPERAAILMDDNASEMSVEREPTSGRWLAIYGSPVEAPPGEHGAGGAAFMPSGRVFYRVADELEGSWSEPTLLYSIPELSAERAPSADPNIVCYAAKGHAEFAPPRRLFLTYVCNLRTLPGESPWPVIERLQRNMDLYRPMPVLLDLPEVLRGD